MEIAVMASFSLARARARDCTIDRDDARMGSGY
jgi:hypothetical protein